MIAWIAIAVGVGWGGWFSQRYAWWRPTVDWSHPRVLMYHMVSESPPDGRYRGMRVSPQAFERQLAWLAGNGFHFATMAEVIAGDVPPRTVVITFDDGYEDNYRAAFPLLRKYGAKATLYLVADRHEGSDWSAKKKSHHNSGELTREPKLTDAQVSEMIESGVFELGAHTLTHENLSKLDADGKHREIADSKTWLESRFGVLVGSFAYPFGIRDQEDCEIVESSGFTNAVTTDPGIDAVPYADAFAIRRIKVSGKENLFAFRIRMRCGRRGLFK
jgi:peptidoglycan/xylan/chitin deacetylase (PgdA/CDA1 family)